MSAYNMLVSRKKLEYIAYNLKITAHANMRIMERIGNNIGKSKIKDMILNSPFWFRDCDESIVVAIDQKRCFIINESEDGFSLTTIKEPSKNGYDIMDKFVLAYMGKTHTRKDGDKNGITSTQGL